MAENLTVDMGEVEPKIEGQAPVATATSEPDPIAALQTQLAEAKERQKAAEDTAKAERRAAQEAQRLVQEREQDIGKYKTAAQSAEMQVLTSAIEAATREVEMAEREFVATLESGEFQKAGKAQTKLSNAAARLVTLEQGKNALEDVQPQPQRQQAPEPPRADPNEVFFSSFSPRTQTWLRQHPEAVQRDHLGRPAIAKRVWAAHLLAEDADLSPDTDEYFTFVEQHGLQRAAPKPAPAEPDPGLDDPDYVPPALAAPAAQPRRTAPVAAPVSRDPPTNSGRPSPTRIRLTAAQADAARISGISEVEYAKQLQELTAEGKIGRTTH